MSGEASGDAWPASRGRKTSKSPSVASLAFGEASPATPGKQRPLRKSIVETFAALTREERSEADFAG